MSVDDLADLERRVTTRYLEALRDRFPFQHIDPNPVDWTGCIDWSAWANHAKPTELPIRAEFAEYLAPPQHQFPRQQLVTFPNRRAVTLILCDRTLDHADTLTDEQWFQLGFLMIYGGRQYL